MTETVQADDRVWRWTVRVLYTTLIAAELWVLWDWWRDTPSGQETMARWQSKVADVKAKAENCEGCAKRKAWFNRKLNRVHWDAMRIVEGEEVETVPDPEVP